MLRICTGSEFQAAGPATVKELSAKRVRCTTKLLRVGTDACMETFAILPFLSGDVRSVRSFDPLYKKKPQEGFLYVSADGWSREHRRR